MTLDTLDLKTIAHYRIVSQLGTGGMGEVYLAEDTKLDRQVALKLLPTQFTQDEDRVRRFMLEAKAASALNHPNIITIHEFGEANGTHYLATEFIDGQTLREGLSERLTLLAALEIAIQVAAALTAAHEAGITHRDIKPENIMVRRDGLVKVLDFGLAKLTERQTQSKIDTDAATRAKVKTGPGTVMGTPQYMSPEQARGQVLDARSDIFSLGVVLYEMITGRPPFRGVNVVDVMGAILKDDPAPLRQRAPGAPVILQHLISKALRKDRDERYQTARDLLNDLKDLKEELSFTAKRARADQAEKNEAVIAPADAMPTAAGAATTTSSDRVLLGEIRRHKVGVALALVLLLGAVATLSYYAFFARRDAGPIDSIAVLPFINQNHDPETDYRSDGLTESIINSLTQLANLRVIARSSVFRYKGREPDSLAIGKELGVRAVLTGRMLQRGDELTISAELVDVRENKQLWGERYERKVADLLAVQHEIAKEISKNLRLKLSGADESRVTKRYTENPEAYQLYLKGRFYWNERTGVALKKSIEYFEQAIEKDPSYALAYAGLADVYVVLPAYSAASPQESFPKGKAAAKRALELDETLAEAHVALAAVLFSYDRNLAESNREYQRAIELNPNYPTTHQWYGQVNLAMQGRFDEAIAEVKRAEELDPLSLIISADLAQTYIYARRYDQAIEQLRKTIEMDPSFYVAHWYLGMAFEMKGSLQEAIAAYRRARQLNDNPRVLAVLGHAYGVTGQREEALRTLDQLKEIARQRYVSGFSLALVYAGLGEKDQALQWLEKGYQDRAQEMARLKVDPLLDNLRSDPRFADLVRRIGL